MDESQKLYANWDKSNINTIYSMIPFIWNYRKWIANITESKLLGPGIGGKDQVKRGIRDFF